VPQSIIEAHETSNTSIVIERSVLGIRLEKNRIGKQVPKPRKWSFENRESSKLSTCTMSLNPRKRWGSGRQSASFDADHGERAVIRLCGACGGVYVAIKTPGFLLPNSTLVRPEAHSSVDHVTPRLYRDCIVPLKAEEQVQLDPESKRETSEWNKSSVRNKPGDERLALINGHVRVVSCRVRQVDFGVNPKR
jgi:hypothetical protein